MKNVNLYIVSFFTGFKTVILSCAAVDVPAAGEGAGGGQGEPVSARSVRGDSVAGRPGRRVGPGRAAATRGRRRRAGRRRRRPRHATARPRRPVAAPARQHRPAQGPFFLQANLGKESRFDMEPTPNEGHIYNRPVIQHEYQQPAKN